jgi:hypothetical protein
MVAPIFISQLRPYSELPSGGACGFTSVP